MKDNMNICLFPPTDTDKEFLFSLVEYHISDWHLAWLLGYSWSASTQIDISRDENLPEIQTYTALQTLDREDVDPSAVSGLCACIWGIGRKVEHSYGYVCERMCVGCVELNVNGCCPSPTFPSLSQVSQSSCCLFFSLVPFTLFQTRLWLIDMVWRLFFCLC